MERSVCDCTPSSPLLTVSVGSVGKSAEKLPSAFLYFFHSPVCPAIGAARQSSSNTRRARARIFRDSNCARMPAILSQTHRTHKPQPRNLNRLIPHDTNQPPLPTPPLSP